MPEVSVIIPTYNRCDLLPRAVKSVKQAGTDVEIIVVDDASTDDTPKVCQSLEGISYLRMERNSGQAAARNAGILASTAEYIAFLDDDDVRLPNTFAKQLNVLEAAPEAAFVYGRVLKGDSECRSIGECCHNVVQSGDIFLKLILTDFIPITAVIARKKHLFDVQLFDPSLKGAAEDWDLLLRLTEKYHVVAIDDPVAIYRIATATSGQATSDDDFIAQAIKNVRARTFKLPRLANASIGYQQDVNKMIRNFDVDMCIWKANEHLINREPIIARALLIEAIRKLPLRSIRPWTLQLLTHSVVDSLILRRSIKNSISR